MTDLLVVDDHPLFRDGFGHMAGALRPAWRLHFAPDAEVAAIMLTDAVPHLLVVDVSLPGEDGFKLAASASSRWPSLPVLMISGRDDAAVRVRARACGARGFIGKATAPDAIAIAIDTVLAGGDAWEARREEAAPVLTPRQAEVLMLLAEGHGNKEIRYRLGIAERTVRAHLTDLFDLLGAHSRTQAILRAREMGLVA